MIDQQTNTLFGWKESWKEVHSLLCALLGKMGEWSELIFLVFVSISYIFTG